MSAVASQYVIELTESLSNITRNDFSKNELQVVHCVSKVFAGISIMGSIVIMASYIKFPVLRSFLFELVLMVVISDFFNASSWFLPANYIPANCVFMTFGELSSVFWIGSIAYTINKIFLRKDDVTIEKNRWKYHVFCWGSAVIFSLLPLSTDDYEGNNGLWCWISTGTSTGVAWAFICYYVPVWLIFFYLSTVYYKIWRFLNLRSTLRREFLMTCRENTLHERWKIDHPFVTRARIAIYPTVFFLTTICTSIDRMLLVIEGKRNFFLVILSVITINFQGFANAFAYGFNAALRAEWSWCFRRRESANVGLKLEGVSSSYMRESNIYQESNINRDSNIYQDSIMIPDDRMGEYNQSYCSSTIMIPL